MLALKILLRCNGNPSADILAQIILEFEGGLKLAFCDPRRFGRIRLQEDPANNEPISKLGFDPVLDMISVEDFTARLAAQRRAIKTVILDQVQPYFPAVMHLNPCKDAPVYYLQLLVETSSTCSAGKATDRNHLVRKGPAGLRFQVCSHPQDC